MNVKDPIEISRLCEGLSHPVRAKIVELLEEVGDLPLHEIDKKLRGSKFERSYQTISSHVKKMESSGIVEMSKDDKDITIVVLKKRIEIIVEDV